MDTAQAETIINAVEQARERDPFASAYSACKAAMVSIADYKAARLAVYGLNESV